MTNKKIINLSATAKQFIANSTIYFIGNVLTKLIGLLLLPLYTSFIPPEDYGYYDLSIVYVTIIASVLFFDLWISIMRFMFDKDDKKYKSQAAKSGLTIFTISAAIYVCVAAVAMYTFDIKHIELIALYGVLSSLASTFAFIARGYGNNKDFVVSGILSTLTNALLSVILLVWISFDFSALYISAIAGMLVQIIYLETRVKIIRQTILAKTDYSLTKSTLLHTLPLAINSAAFWLLTGYNRIIISQEMSITDNGIYAIAAKFILAVTLITTVFNLAWQETLFSKAAKRKIEMFYGKSSNFYMALLLGGGALLLPMFNVIFGILVDTSYSLARDLIPLLLVSALLSAYVAYQGSMFHSIKRTSVQFYSMIAASIVNVSLCTLLVRFMGLNGATLATILGLLVCIAIRMVILNKQMKHKFEPAVILLLSLLSASSFIYLQYGAVINILYAPVLSCLVLLILYSLYTTSTKKEQTI